MRILITIYEKPGFGGAEVSTETLIKGLKELGHDVFVASARDWSEVTKTFKFWGFRTKLPIFLLQEIYLKSFLKKVIKENRIDIVHAQDRLTTAGAIKAAKAMNIPSVVSIRDYWFACPNSSCCTPEGEVYDTYGFKQLIKERPVNRILWNLYKMFELKRIRRVLNKADKKLAISKCVLNKLEINNIVGSEVIPITRDLSKFLKNNKEEHTGTIITYVGNLATNKGIMEILKWMPRYLEMNPYKVFMIVGDGVLKPRIKEMVEKNKQIVFMGKVDHKDMPEIYSTTDTLLFPSLWEEPYGGVVLESMASGVTVIASDRGGHLDVIKHKVNGYVADPKNHWKWISPLSKDNKSLKVNARETIKKEYNLKKIIKDIEGVYKCVLN